LKVNLLSSNKNYGTSANNYDKNMNRRKELIVTTSGHNDTNYY